MDASTEVDPAASTEDLLADQLDCDQAAQADSVGPVCRFRGGGGSRPERRRTWQTRANGDEEHLLLLEAVELGHLRGRTDLQNADHGEQQNEAKKNPIEVAETNHLIKSECRG